MRSTIASEWIKFRTVRSTVIALCTTVLLCVGIGAIASFATRQQWARDGFANHLAAQATAVSLGGFFLGELAIGVIGVLVISSEYSSGLIRATLAATPTRLPVLASKALVLFAATLVIGEICSFASFFVGQAILSGVAASATLASPGALEAVVLAGLSLALLALLALGIGTMLRHTAGSITVYVSLLLVIFLIVLSLPASWNTRIFRYLPEVLTQSMRNPASGNVQFHAFSPGVSALVLAAYAMAALIGGGFVLWRRDA
jgi:ABC-type transport system involved in multi-copper enzyme maturation permease subunit